MAVVKRGRYDSMLRGVATAAKAGMHAYRAYRAVTNKATNRKNGPIVEVQKNDAQYDIGYGQHDAKIIPGSRRRLNRRKRVQKRKFKRQVQQSLTKKQKILVKKIAKKRPPVNFPKRYAKFEVLKSCDTGGVAGKQALQGFVEDTGYTGWSTPTDKGNQLGDVFNSCFQNTDVDDAFAGLQTNAEMFKKFKIHILGSETRYNIVSSSTCPKAQVDVHFFMCKKSLRYDDLRTTGGVNTPADIKGGSLTSTADALGDGFIPQDIDRSATGTFIRVDNNDTAFDPRYHNQFLGEYFRHERTQRFQVGANSNIVIDNKKRIGMTMSAKTVFDYAFIKNVSRFVVVTACGTPYFNVESIGITAEALDAPAAGNFHLCVKQDHQITWKPVFMDTAMMNDSRFLKLATASVVNWEPVGVTSDTTRLDIG